MHSEQSKKRLLRDKRALRVRSKLHGTAVKPRLSVFKSNKHLAVQLIDDDAGVTLFSASTYTKGSAEKRKSKAAATAIGSEIASKMQEKQIKEMVFDRGCARYHGILEALADAIRDGGIHV